jgi:hypothetical protein
MSEPTYHTRRHDPEATPHTAPPSVGAAAHASHVAIWEYHCQPTFAAIRQDLDTIQHALFIGDERESITARIHSNSKAIRLLLSIHLLVVTAVITILATALYDAWCDNRPSSFFSDAGTTPGNLIQNIKSPLDEYTPYPVPFEPSKRVAYMPTPIDLGGSCHREPETRP